MGTVYLNALCAERTLGELKDEKTKDLLTTHRDVYMLGTAGTDLFRYFDAFSKDENTWLRDIASSLDEEGADLFDRIKRYIAKAPAADREVLTAYALGMGLRHCLMYRTRGYYETLPKKGTGRAADNALYAAVDSAVLGSAPDVPALPRLLGSIPEKECLAIEKMYSVLIEEKKRAIIPDGIVKDCCGKLVKALSQKKSLLPIPRPGKEFVYTPSKDEEDLLNTSHRRWTDPSGDSCNFSVPEMCGYAVRDAKKLLVKLGEAIGRGIAGESCEFLFRNLK